MSFDSHEFRDALGSFATGVCVVTTQTADNKAFGVTVNSFASVSLQPPLVLWSLQNDSECVSVFDSCDNYAINILAEDQQHLSTLYATKNDHLLETSHYHLGKTGMPIIRGAVASFECRLWARYPGGDHSIIVGEVIAMHSQQHQAPLIFSTGQYHRLR